MTAIKNEGAMRLNRYIAKSGLCTRREADALIKRGEISVNGKVVSQMGTQINPLSDRVTYNGKAIDGRSLYYILLNKPGDYITQGKGGKSVHALMRGSSDERIYPIHPLSKFELGLQLFTNDEALKERLESLKEVDSLYHLLFDKEIPDEVLAQLKAGKKLKGKIVKALEVVRTADEASHGLGLKPSHPELLSELLKALDLTVTKLDRVSYAGLTKKNLPRGKWRALDAREVGFIQMASR